MLFAVVLVLLATVRSIAVNPLGPYAISDTTVSGISSGGYMAVQVHIAFSSWVNGSAVFAAGPYYCAQSNVLLAEYKCMKTYYGLPNVLELVTETTQASILGTIDNVRNLYNDKVYIFSGKDDTVVEPDVVHALQSFYSYFVKPNQITANFELKAEHCMPTTNTEYGEDCTTLSSPYIGKCSFDGAEAAFKTLYGDLHPRTEMIAENLMSFDQSQFNSFSQTSLSDKGYIYVPTACQRGEKCHLHFAFHGCLQGLDFIGNDWATKSGYGEWAESNKVIVVFPYADSSQILPMNPNGCWDWWGYTNPSYGLKSGVQMQFIYNLHKALTSK